MYGSTLKSEYGLLSPLKDQKHTEKMTLGPLRVSMPKHLFLNKQYYSFPPIKNKQTKTSLFVWPQHPSHESCNCDVLDFIHILTKFSLV